jgi:uncharacterized DUF497 family protein
MELPPDEALKIIQDILRDGSVVPIPHAKERMVERNCDMQDVRRILKTGSISKKEDVKGRCRYSIKGDNLEGKAMVVVIEIHRRGIVRIITVM